MRTIKRIQIDGYTVDCLPSGTLRVTNGTNGTIVVTVLAHAGTHAALNQFGPDTKKKIQDWWKSVR